MTLDQRMRDWPVTPCRSETGVEVGLVMINPETLRAWANDAHALQERVRELEAEVLDGKRCADNLRGMISRKEAIIDVAAARTQELERALESTKLEKETRDGQLATLLRELCPDITPYPTMNQARDRIRALDSEWEAAIGRYERAEDAILKIRRIVDAALPKV